MTMSTYKSLGGPAGGLIVTNDADLAERLDAIAYPGLTANFDAGKTAALAITLLDWKAVGHAYAQAMVETARRWPPPSSPLGRAGLRRRSRRDPVAPVRGARRTTTAAARPPRTGCAGPTCSPAASACPAAPVDGDVNGLRIGTPELVRLGMTDADMPDLASFIARGLDPSLDPATVAPEVTEWRHQFGGIHFTVDQPK